MEKYSTQLYSMQHLCESIDKEFALAGASSWVLACVIQTLRAGVNLGVKVVDIIIGREIQEGLHRNDIGDFELTLGFTQADGLRETTTLINMNMYPDIDTAGKQQDFFLHTALQRLMSRETTAPLSDDVGALIGRLLPDSVVRASTKDAMSKLQTLVDNEGQQMTEALATTVSDAMSAMEADARFKDLLEDTQRGRALVRSTKAMLQQRLADMRCKTQCAELNGLVGAFEARLKIKWRGQCCMVSVHEHIMFIAPCFDGIVALQSSSSASFMSEHKGEVDALVQRVGAAAQTLVDAQRLQSWQALVKVAEYCAQAATSKTTQAADDEIAKELESPALISSLMDTESSGLNKVLRHEQRNHVDQQISKAASARGHLATLFDKLRSREFETMSFFTDSMAGSIEVLCSSDCCEPLAERYLAAMTTIKRSLGKHAGGLLESICGKFEGVAKCMAAIVGAKEPRRLATTLGRDVTVEACMEVAELVPKVLQHLCWQGGLPRFWG